MEPTPDVKSALNVAKFVTNSIGLIFKLQDRSDEYHALVVESKRKFSDILSRLKDNESSFAIDQLSPLIDGLHDNISTLRFKVCKLRTKKKFGFERLESEIEKLNEKVKDQLTNHSVARSNFGDFQSSYKQLEEQFDILCPEGRVSQARSAFSKKFYACVFVLNQIVTIPTSYQWISNNLSPFNVKECNADGSRKRLEELNLYERIIRAC